MRIDEAISDGIEELIDTDGQVLTLESGDQVAVFSPPNTGVDLELMPEGYEPEVDRTCLAIFGSVDEMGEVDVDDVPVNSTLRGVLPANQTLVQFDGEDMRIAGTTNHRSFIELKLKLVR